MTFKKITGFIHLWFGLTTGLVVFIIAITGAIYCFAPEIEIITQKYRSVEKKEVAFLAPSQLKIIAEKQLPGKPVKRITYAQNNKAAVALFYGKGGYYYAVFINPYTGQVLKVKNMRKDFFTIILYLHMTLLIPYGDLIVKWSTFIFVFMLISGIILWWPKNKAARKQRFKIKFGTSPKRLNYDLHNVLGFYASWIVLFIALTGLMWAFTWFANGVYAVTGKNKSTIKKDAPLSDTTKTAVNTALQPVDIVWKNLSLEKNNHYLITEIGFPDQKKDAFSIRANTEESTYYKADMRFFDQLTGLEIKGSYVWGKYNDAHTLADKIQRMNYDIHVGAILGLPGRFIAFFASLIIASLPITGFLIWRGRNKKRKVNNAITAIA